MNDELGSARERSNSDAGNPPRLSPGPNIGQLLATAFLTLVLLCLFGFSSATSSTAERKFLWLNPGSEYAHCQPTAGGACGTAANNSRWVYSHFPYTVSYQLPNDQPAGTYRIDLTYGNWGGPAPTDYRYQLQLLVNGAVIRQFSVDPPRGGPLLENKAIGGIPLPEGGAEVSVRWLNDVNEPGVADANFGLWDITVSNFDPEQPEPNRLPIETLRKTTDGSGATEPAPNSGVRVWCPDRTLYLVTPGSGAGQGRTAARVAGGPCTIAARTLGQYRPAPVSQEATTRNPEATEPSTVRLTYHPNRPPVGAIRFDAWWDGNTFKSGEVQLQESEWFERLPFYARLSGGCYAQPSCHVDVDGDTPETMRREINYASNAGLDYWAFDYFGQAGARYDYGVRLYDQAPNKDKLNFALTLTQHLANTANGHSFDQEIPQMVEYFKQPSYQKMYFDRPLIFLYCPDLECTGDKGFVSPGRFASADEFRAALDRLRQATVDAGLRKPYIVDMTARATDGDVEMDLYDLDAIGGYTHKMGATRGPDQPFDNLRQDNLDYWNQIRDIGRPPAPIVNVGWDPRPLWDVRPGHTDEWYRTATPAQAAASIKTAIDWTQAHYGRGATRAILIYAWNETTEGGWLHPTLNEGSARLDALAQVLLTP